MLGKSKSRGEEDETGEGRYGGAGYGDPCSCRAARRSTQRGAAGAAAYATGIYDRDLPMLRSSFTDVWLFDKRKGLSDIEDSEGAQFSYADDRIAQNRTWTAHAMGAVVFQYLHDRYPKDDRLNFIGLSVAPFVQIDRISNSSPKAIVNNVDEVSFGGSSEIGFDLGPGAN